MPIKEHRRQLLKSMLHSKAISEAEVDADLKQKNEEFLGFFFTCFS